MLQILVLLVVLYLIYCYMVSTQTVNDPTVEGYNNQTGRFCTTCDSQTPNQCLGCFNCGFCVDKQGNARCMGGDHNGPYNNENCAAWYHGDPFSRMLQNNSNYRCSYGPKSSNRLIGI